MNQVDRNSFLAWPGWPQLRFAWLQTALLTAWFGVVYSGADWLTARRLTRVRVHLNLELQIPLVPAFTVFYMSVYLLFLAVPFVLRTRREISTLAITQGIVILMAGIGFLLFPAELAYAPPTDLGMWEGLFRFADRLNLDYNLVPSLHVALSVVCLESFAARLASAGKTLLRGWGLLIAASTLFTHQHHLIDAVTGYLLAFAAVSRTRLVEARCRAA